MSETPENQQGEVQDPAEQYKVDQNVETTQVEPESEQESAAGVEVRTETVVEPDTQGTQDAQGDSPEQQN